MPPPPKATRKPRTDASFTVTTLDEYREKDKRDKELIKQHDEADRQREEYERKQREIDERIRLDEEFNEWLRQEQIKQKERLRVKKEVNEILNEWLRQQQTQSSENPELIAASITLGIPIDSNMHKINQAYHKLAKRTHPDKHPNNPDATAKFQKLLEAYEILSAYQKLSSMPKKGGNKCRNRRTSHHMPKKTQTHRHATHHRKTHRNYN